MDNFKLSEELETQKLNLRDINEFLTNELKARSLTTSALESKVQELNVLVEDVRRSHEVRALGLGCIRWRSEGGDLRLQTSTAKYLIAELDRGAGHYSAHESLQLMRSWH